MAKQNTELAAALAKVAELEAKLAKKQAPRAISFKVSQKGAVSAYGLGRFPVTLYGSQWERLLERKDDILAFLAANKADLATKG